MRYVRQEAKFAYLFFYVGRGKMGENAPDASPCQHIAQAVASTQADVDQVVAKEVWRVDRLALFPMQAPFNIASIMPACCMHGSETTPPTARAL